MTATTFGWALAAPAWLWLLPLLLVAAACRHRRRRSVLFAPAALLATRSAAAGDLPCTWRTRCRHLPFALEGAAMACLVLAMARPVERTPAPPLPPGRDLLLCLDVSSSMAATDLQPDRTRHDVGVQLAADFVQARPHDRLGLVAFARYADLRCPLTRDHAAVRELLATLRLVEKEGPEDATAIGAAVARAAAALRSSAASGKVVVVVTDGEENVATALAPDEIAPLHAGQLCAELGIRVHAIVVGRGNQKPDGRFVALDTQAVQQLAAATGGRFFAASDARALGEVYAAIDALETTAPPAPGVFVHERFPWALALGLSLWALARGLRATALRRLP